MIKNNFKKKLTKLQSAALPLNAIFCIGVANAPAVKFSSYILFSLHLASALTDSLLQPYLHRNLETIPSTPMCLYPTVCVFITRQFRNFGSKEVNWITEWPGGAEDLPAPVYLHLRTWWSCFGSNTTRLRVLPSRLKSVGFTSVNLITKELYDGIPFQIAIVSGGYWGGGKG